MLFFLEEVPTFSRSIYPWVSPDPQIILKIHTKDAFANIYCAPEAILEG